MNTLSLFDGVSCARLALEKSGVDIGIYYASETDKFASKVTLANRPDTIALGDVRGVGVKSISQTIDLLIGGSPCQDLSIAKKDRKGLDGERSGLFYEYVRIRDEIKPQYFILENVASMSKDSRDTISSVLGVQPVMINAALVSGQQRKRYFWVGKLVDGKYRQVSIPQPEDRGIFLKDVLLDGDTEDLKSLCITATYASKGIVDYEKKSMGQMIRIGDIGSSSQAHRVCSPEGKSVALSAQGGGQGAKTGLYLIVPEATKQGYAIANDGDSVDVSFMGSKTRRGRVGPRVKNLMTSGNIGTFTGGVLRKLHPIECERLQGMPDEWTNPTGDISNSQRYKMCGNAFNVDVVAHIISKLN
jgi:DNA-cytosine methyltransferase